MRIRNLVVLLVSVLLLGITGLSSASATVDHTPGSTYYASPTALWMCASRRPGPEPGAYKVDYANPIYMDSTQVHYSCRDHRHDPNVVCSYVVVDWGPGTLVTGPHDTACASW
jgi:hypothetical protein